MKGAAEMAPKGRYYKGEYHYGEYDSFQRFKQEVDYNNQRKREQIKADTQAARSQFMAAVNRFRTYKGSSLSQEIDACFIDLRSYCDWAWQNQDSSYLSREVDGLISRVEREYNAFKREQEEQRRRRDQVISDQRDADRYFNQEIRSYFGSRDSNVNRAIDRARSAYQSERNESWDRQDASGLRFVAQRLISDVQSVWDDYKSRHPTVEFGARPDGKGSYWDYGDGKRGHSRGEYGGDGKAHYHEHWKDDKTGEHRVVGWDADPDTGDGTTYDKKGKKIK